MSGVAVSYMRYRIWLIRSQLIGLGQVFPIKFLPFQLRKRASFAEVIEQQAGPVGGFPGDGSVAGAGGGA